MGVRADVEPCKGEASASNLVMRVTYLEVSINKGSYAHNLMIKKTRRSLKGIGDYWEETKRPLNLTITPTAIEGLENLAKARELSKSELIERIGRGVIPLGDQVG